RHHFVDTGGYHDESEFDLKRQQAETAYRRRVSGGQLEHEDRGAEPGGNESWRAHSPEHAAPAHVYEEVVAQQQVDTGRGHDGRADDETDGRGYPHGEDRRAHDRVLKRVDRAASLGVAAPPFAYEIAA